MVQISNNDLGITINVEPSTYYIDDYCISINWAGKYTTGNAHPSNSHFWFNDKYGGVINYGEFDLELKNKYPDWNYDLFKSNEIRIVSYHELIDALSDNPYEYNPFKVVSKEEFKQYFYDYSLYSYYEEEIDELMSYLDETHKYDSEPVYIVDYEEGRGGYYPMSFSNKTELYNEIKYISDIEEEYNKKYISDIKN